MNRQLCMLLPAWAMIQFGAWLTGRSAVGGAAVLLVGLVAAVWVCVRELDRPVGAVTPALPIAGLILCFAWPMALRNPSTELTAVIVSFAMGLDMMMMYGSQTGNRAAARSFIRRFRRAMMATPQAWSDLMVAAAATNSRDELRNLVAVATSSEIPPGVAPLFDAISDMASRTPASKSAVGDLPALLDDRRIHELCELRFRHVGSLLVTLARTIRPLPIR